MGRAYIEAVLGELGVSVLHFYEANSLWINAFVVLYGAWVVFSWINLKSIRKSLIMGLAAQMKSRPEFTGEEAPDKKAIKSLRIPWESAVEKSRFPFVAQQSALLPRRLSVDTVRGMLTVDDLAAEALAVLKGGDTPRAKQTHR